jgi:hypothetical protein
MVRLFLNIIYSVNSASCSFSAHKYQEDVGVLVGSMTVIKIF